MNIIKRTHSTNNNKIILVSSDDICPTGQISSENQKTILIIGVIHGDEPQGKFLIENYLKTNNLKQKNKLLFIPCINPDGLALETRQNANGVDLNRNFPTKNWGEDAKINEKTNAPLNSEYFGGKNAASEIETKFLIEVIEEFSPDIILTIHAPYKVVNYDGPAEDIASKISNIINYPVQKDIGYPTPGSFGTFAGIERNIPVITLELDEEIEVGELVSPINKIFDYLAKV